MNKQMTIILASGCALILVGAGLYIRNRAPTGTPNLVPAQNQVKSEEFQRTGQNSFGLDVCNEMTADDVGVALGKTVSKTRDYSNNSSTGCEYYIEGNHFVIVDVGYSDMESQRRGLQALDRTLKEDARIGLSNFLSYSDRGLIDVYMNVAEGKKFVRVGRSSTTVTSEEDLIKLALAVEKKIRSYK